MQWWNNRGRDPRAFPADELGDAMWEAHRKRRLALTEAWEFEFWFAFPQLEQARKFAKYAESEWYEVQSDEGDEGEDSMVFCLLREKPLHANQKARFDRLQAQAKSSGASSHYGPEISRPEDTAGDEEA